MSVFDRESFVDSGVGYLGEIPADVTATKVAYIFSQTNAGEIIDKSYWDVGDETLYTCKRTPMLSNFDDFPVGKRTTKNDLLLTRNGTPYVHKPEQNAIYSNVVQRITLNTDFDRDYVAYALSNSALSLKGYGVSIESLNFEMWKELKLVKFSKTLQCEIAQFLNSETSRIDCLITEKQMFIELLKEKRQALISHFVTKGLDANVPMKDSGVGVLGKVPLGWTVGNLSYFVDSIGDVDHYMPPSVDEGIPYVMTGDLSEYASGIDFGNCKQVTREEYLKLSKRIKTSEGDVIMARYATIGTATYVDIDKEFLVSYSCVTIKPKLGQLNGLYLYYFIKSDAFLEGVRSHINTNTQGNVGVGDLKKVKIALPSIAEQKAICDHIGKKLKSLDDVQRETERSVNLLKEHRTALISAAVTGKIDVRGIVDTKEGAA
jgi:restriction endonuclease S subunit